MNCRGCSEEAVESAYGPWCEKCGGVMYRSGEPHVRHIATAHGEGGEFKILYDHSLASYTASIVRLIRTWVEIKGEFIQAERTFTHQGTLDTMIALVQPWARGQSGEIPTITVGPGSTEDERQVVEETFDPTRAIERMKSVRMESFNIDG